MAGGIEDARDSLGEGLHAQDGGGALDEEGAVSAGEEPGVDGAVCRAPAAVGGIVTALAGGILAAVLGHIGK